MAISQRRYIYLTFILSCASFGLIITSFASQYWLNATLRGKTDTTSGIELNYGLFSGMMTRSLLSGSASTYELYIQCLMDLNICAWSCIPDSQLREDEIRTFYDNNQYTFSCPTSLSKSLNLMETFDDEINGKDYNRYLNAGIWVTTIFFICVGLLMSFLSAIMSLINTVTSPIVPIFNILGVFIWNSIAGCSLILSIIIWGANFNINLASNIAYMETIAGYFDVISSSLNFSFWFLLIASFFHAINIGALAYRRYLLNNLPEVKVIEIDDNNDGGIFLY